MNIFACDENPTIAAQSLPDKLIVKMPLETAQILSTVVWKTKPNWFQDYSDILYKPTHKNHPATLWSSYNKTNTGWLALHGVGLCKEYTKRYNREHNAQSIIELCMSMLGIEGSEYSNHEPFVQCMPQEYKIPNNPIQAYRNYMIKEKSYYAKWKNNNKPGWWCDG